VRLRPEQLDAHLAQTLLPLYVLSGEEPLQREEGLDALRAAARARGFEERESMRVDRRFDWGAMTRFGDELSLFAARRILELRAAGRLDDAGRKALAAWCAHPPEDVLLILVLEFRVDGQMARAKWFSTLERTGAHLQVWPVSPARMPDWVRARARRAGVSLDPSATALLAERSEGNLLAGAQEVAKLALLHPGETVGADEVLAATADSARYDAFDLVDACFGGDAARALRILRALREEGLRLPEVLGAVAWAVRSAAEVAPAASQGVPLDRALAPHHGAWRNPARRQLLEAVLARHPPRRWGRLIRQLSRIDRRAKGDSGRLVRRLRGEERQAWGELESLALALAGVSLAPARPYTAGTAG
jgi:DNA polymerase-3 subunit delta